MHLLTSLRKLAVGGRAIITTIHQPSSRLYQQLDKLLLLSQGCAVSAAGSATEVIHDNITRQFCCWVMLCSCMPGRRTLSAGWHDVACLPRVAGTVMEFSLSVFMTSDTAVHTRVGMQCTTDGRRRRWSGSQSSATRCHTASMPRTSSWIWRLPTCPRTSGTLADPLVAMQLADKPASAASAKPRYIPAATSCVMLMGSMLNTLTSSRSLSNGHFFASATGNMLRIAPLIAWCAQGRRGEPYVPHRVLRDLRDAAHPGGLRGEGRRPGAGHYPAFCRHRLPHHG